MDRRLKTALTGALDRLGFQIARKRPLSWGKDPDRDQRELLKASPVEVIADVGANVGDAVDRYRANFPGATIHAFEPFPDAYRELAARFGGDPRIRSHHRAVTNASGTRRLYVNDAHQTNSLLPFVPSSVAWAGASGDLGKTVEVPAVTLDAFCAAEGVTRIDLLAMDIQGGEGLALEGATELLSRQAVRLIYIEVLFAPLYQGQACFCDISRILNGHGYRLFGLYNLAHGERGLGWGDAIFRPL